MLGQVLYHHPPTKADGERKLILNKENIISWAPMTCRMDHLQYVIQKFNESINPSPAG